MGLRAGLDCRLMIWYGIVTTYLLWLSFGNLSTRYVLPGLEDSFVDSADLLTVSCVRHYASLLSGSQQEDLPHLVTSGQARVQVPNADELSLTCSRNIILPLPASERLVSHCYLHLTKAYPVYCLEKRVSTN